MRQSEYTSLVIANMVMLIMADTLSLISFVLKIKVLIEQFKKRRNMHSVDNASAKLRMALSTRAAPSIRDIVEAETLRVAREELNERKNAYGIRMHSIWTYIVLASVEDLPIAVLNITLLVRSIQDCAFADRRPEFTCERAFGGLGADASVGKRGFYLLMVSLATSTFMLAYKLLHWEQIGKAWMKKKQIDRELVALEHKEEVFRLKMQSHTFRTTLLKRSRELAADSLGKATFDSGADAKSPDRTESELTSGAIAAVSTRRKSILARATSVPEMLSSLTKQGAEDWIGVLPDPPLNPLTPPLKHHTPVKLNVFYEGDNETAVLSVVSTPVADGAGDADGFGSEEQEVAWVGCRPVMSPSRVNGASSWA